MKRDYQNAITGMLVCVMVCLLMFSHSAFGLEASVESSLPFKPGERLTYVLKWGKIPAGEAVLEVMPVNTLDGEDVYHFSMRVETNSFVDVFYKVRDKMEGFTNLDVTHSMLYKAKQREGGYKRDMLVNFDWDKQQAQYSNGKRAKDPIEIPIGTFDPLSALYYTRLVPPQESVEIIRPVTDGRKAVNGVVKVVKKQTIKVPAGKFETFLVEPSTEGIGGVFKKSKKAKIQLWMSADERRIPVKIKSKVAVGSFVGELVKVEHIEMTTANK